MTVNDSLITAGKIKTATRKLQVGLHEYTHAARENNVKLRREIIMMRLG